METPLPLYNLFLYLTILTGKNKNKFIFAPPCAEQSLALFATASQQLFIPTDKLSPSHLFPRLNSPSSQPLLLYGEVLLKNKQTKRKKQTNKKKPTTLSIYLCWRPVYRRNHVFKRAGFVCHILPAPGFKAMTVSQIRLADRRWSAFPVSIPYTAAAKLSVVITSVGTSAEVLYLFHCGSS